MIGGVNFVKAVCFLAAERVIDGRMWSSD